MSRSDIALAPLRALTGLSVRRRRRELPRIMPQGALALSMRPSHASLAGNPADVVAVVVSAAGSAISGICASAVGIVAGGSGQMHGGGMD
eukprot:7316889-Pyramimonas_sp.AAC.1